MNKPQALIPQIIAFFTWKFHKNFVGGSNHKQGHQNFGKVLDCFTHH